MQNFHKEAGIQEMQNCMFDTADILVNRGPVIYFVFCKRCFIVFRVGIAQIIPG